MFLIRGVWWILFIYVYFHLYLLVSRPLPLLPGESILHRSTQPYFWALNLHYSDYKQTNTTSKTNHSNKSNHHTPLTKKPTQNLSFLWDSLTESLDSVSSLKNAKTSSAFSVETHGIWTCTAKTLFNWGLADRLVQVGTRSSASLQTTFYLIQSFLGTVNLLLKLYSQS